MHFTPMNMFIICTIMVIGICGGTVMYVRHIINEHSSNITQHLHHISNEMSILRLRIGGLPEGVQPNVPTGPTGGSDRQSLISVSDDEASLLSADYNESDSDIDDDESDSGSESGSENDRLMMDHPIRVIKSEHAIDSSDLTAPEMSDQNDSMTIEDTTIDINIEPASTIDINEQSNPGHLTDTILEPVDVDVISPTLQQLSDASSSLMLDSTAESNYKKMPVANLRQIAVDKGLMNIADKLKKPELIALLEK